MHIVDIYPTPTDLTSVRQSIGVNSKPMFVQEYWYANGFFLFGKFVINILSSHLASLYLNCYILMSIDSYQGLGE